jgi:hypothetical protein
LWSGVRFARPAHCANNLQHSRLDSAIVPRRSPFVIFPDCEFSGFCCPVTVPLTRHLNTMNFDSCPCKWFVGGLLARFVCGICVK